VAQKISIRHEGNEAIDDLLKEISKVDKRKEVVLKLIDIYNEKIEEPGEGKDPEVFKQKKEELVILQLNTDQEQHERIQFRNCFPNDCHIIDTMV
jgi:methionine synthase II (cobalamin-independent)